MVSQRSRFRSSQEYLDLTIKFVAFGLCFQCQYCLCLMGGKTGLVSAEGEAGQRSRLPRVGGAFWVLATLVTPPDVIDDVFVVVYGCKFPSYDGPRPSAKTRRYAPKVITTATMIRSRN
jgi:Sec-independent protein secretion pathway component TatC